MNGTSEEEDSPNHNSQQIVSDDDEIDYSTKPEFYDPKLDDRNELWAQKQRGGHTSDAVLSCPACFTTLCLDCQRYVLSSETNCTLNWTRLNVLGVDINRLLVHGQLCGPMDLPALTADTGAKGDKRCRHEKYVTQYRAIFVVNCKIKEEEMSQAGSKRKRKKRGSQTDADNTEAVKHVCCLVCSTDVGVFDEDEVYHFFNVIPSEA